MRGRRPGSALERALALWMALALLACMAATAGAQQESGEGTDPARSGRGWSLVRLDVDVSVDPERGVLETEGVVTLRLSALDESYGPLLLLNLRKTRDGEPAIAFRRVESDAARTHFDEELMAGLLHQALIQFDEPVPRGSTVEVRFECATRGTARRMIAHPSAAMADWLAGWLPFSIPGASDPESISAALLAAPGETTLRLPAGWKGLVDGELVERRESTAGVVELWRTPEGIARGFVAGPYEVVTETVGGRSIQVYLLDPARRGEAGRLAERLGSAISALEAKLGPLPVPGPYSVVDFPHLPEQSFGGVSEQTHVIVQPPNLDYAFDNIQLLAHESAHAWWGNAIGTTGPGAKWCGESLAQLGAVIALEALEGEEAVGEFLDFARLGTDPYYSAAGYFALLRQGQDRPIATMGQGVGTHALANSKGVWVFHMLRHELGDDLFFGVLRQVIREYAGRGVTAELSVDGLRERFLAAAPDRDLEAFFAQWLDRIGAPVFAVDWHANADGTGLLLELAQVQEGEPFALDLEVGIELGDGSETVERVTVGDASHVFEIETGSRPTGVRLDPGHKVLIWRPEYGPRPVAEIVSDSMRVPAALLDAVVGWYRFEGIEKDVEVFAREGSLYMQPAGSAPVRLLPESGGLFRVDGPGGMQAEFDLSRSPAPSFVSIEGGGRERYVARRVVPGDSGNEE